MPVFRIICIDQAEDDVLANVVLPGLANFSHRLLIMSRQEAEQLLQSSRLSGLPGTIIIRRSNDRSSSNIHLYANWFDPPVLAVVQIDDSGGTSFIPVTSALHLWAREQATLFYETALRLLADLEDAIYANDVVASRQTLDRFYETLDIDREDRALVSLLFKVYAWGRSKGDWSRLKKAGLLRRLNQARRRFERQANELSVGGTEGRPKRGLHRREIYLKSETLATSGAGEKPGRQNTVGIEPGKKDEDVIDAEYEVKDEPSRPPASRASAQSPQDAAFFLFLGVFNRIRSRVRERTTSILRAVSSELPVEQIDRVHFTLTAPTALRIGSLHEIKLWAHLNQEREEVISRARRESPTEQIQSRSKGPLDVARGNVLTVTLKLEGLDVTPVQDTILWQAEIGSASFLVSVPTTAQVGRRAGEAAIHINGVRLLVLTFAIDVSASSSSSNDPVQIEAREKRFKSAFASYANDDRNDVLARIQGIQKVAPQMDIFLDVASLRSGELWEERLRKEIVDRDVLYLFWSRAAKDSKWVDWEWRCALKEHGIEGIDPVPLVKPEEVPPPDELKRLHFGEWIHAYERCGKGRRSRTPIRAWLGGLFHRLTFHRFMKFPL